MFYLQTRATRGTTVCEKNYCDAFPSVDQVETKDFHDAPPLPTPTKQSPTMSTDSLSLIRKELMHYVEPAYKAGAILFFKEKINPLGVRTPIVRKIARMYFPKEATKQEVFALCEQLLQKKTYEETLIAFDWAVKQTHEFEKNDFARLERWLKTYVNNWAFCDDFCTHAFGALITRYPELLSKTKKWRVSENRWLRRASAIILIHPMMKKKKEFLKDVFEAADALLVDDDDLVQKGYGWMLKIASNSYPADVFQFVMKRKNTMPRTALRYAIEKYPKEMKKSAMK